jgi:alkylation response protein AidB-like acyl-CoA dehydrogenase
MNFGWTEEQTMWRKAVHDFAQKKIAPRCREIDDNGIPQDVLDGMTDMGLWAPTVSEKYGGGGMNVTMATIRGLGRQTSACVAGHVLVQASWGTLMVRRELKAEILPKVTAGSCSWYRPTEPGGSDIEA